MISTRRINYEMQSADANEARTRKLIVKRYVRKNNNTILKQNQGLV